MNECREGRSEKERERKRKKENMSMSCFLSNIMLTKLLLVSLKNNILGLCNSVSLATSVLGEPLHSICQCFVWGILSLFLTPSASSTKENRVRNGIQMYGQEKQRQQQQNNLQLWEGTVYRYCLSIFSKQPSRLVLNDPISQIGTLKEGRKGETEGGRKELQSLPV